MASEGVTKFHAEHTPGALPSEAEDRFAAIGAWRRIFFMLGLIGADPARYGGVGYGNVSCRLTPYPGERGRRRFVVTGTQTADRWELGPQKLSVVEAYDARANWLRSSGPTAPSSESLTHGALYDLSPRIRSVLHVHAPLIWSYADVLRLPTSDPSAAYGTPEMAWEVGRLFRESTLPDCRVLVMGGHEDGVIAFGHDLEESGEVLVRYLASAHALTLA